MRKSSDPTTAERAVGQVLKSLRRESGLTATAVAYRLGMSESNYLRYESGANQLNVLQIGDFAWALEVDPRELFERVRPMLLSASRPAPAQERVPSSFDSQRPARSLVDRAFVGVGA